MFKLIDVKKKPLTRELATEFATMTPLPGERPVSRGVGGHAGRLGTLKNLLLSGLFTDPDWATAKSKEDNQIYRANGQHSSLMLTGLTDEEFPKGLSAVIKSYVIDSVEQDAMNLFDLFDNPLSARSNQDAMGVLKARHPEMAGMSNQFAFAVSAGIQERERHVQDGSLYKARKRGMYFEEERYREFASWLFGWHDPSLGRNLGLVLRHPGVIAEMLKDFEQDRETATRAWGHVIMQDETDPDSLSQGFINELSRMNREPSYKQDAFQRKAERFWKQSLKQAPVFTMAAR
jgi:hypothetical protein